MEFESLEPTVVRGGCDVSCIDGESPPNRSMSKDRIRRTGRMSGTKADSSSYMECGDDAGLWMIMQKSSFRVFTGSNQQNRTRRQQRQFHLEGSDDEVSNDPHLEEEDEHFWATFVLITLTVFTVMVCAIGLTMFGQQDIIEGNGLLDPKAVEEDIMIKPLYGQEGALETMSKTKQLPRSSSRPPLSTLVTDLQNNTIM